MEALSQNKDNLRVRTINIGDWRSPVAKQHRVRRLPYLVLYKGTELQADSPPAVSALLNSL